MKKVHTASPSTPCTHHDYVIPCHIQSLTQHLGIVGSMLEMCSSIPLPSANAHPLHLVQMLTINAHHLPFQAYKLSTLTGTQVLLLVLVFSICLPLPSSSYW